MIRKTLLILIVLTTILSACGSRRARLDHKHMIPEKDLVPILADIYLTDGLVGMPRITMKYAPFDSISTYNHIIEKHGYTKDAMDKTMKYYFIRDPKRLIKIYDKVLIVLSEMESRIQKEIAKTKTKPGTLWNGQDLYSLPDPSGSDSLSFELPLIKPGIYTLSATVTVFPDDKSYKPSLQAYTSHPDSIFTGKRHYSQPVPFIKDGNPHRYNLTFSLGKNDRLHVRGILADTESKTDLQDQHLLIQNITFIYASVEK